VNDVLVRYTLFGDADLSGSLTSNDYFQIDTGFVANRTGWINGDFDYDGTITTNDYFLIDNAFLAQSQAAAGTGASAPAVGLLPPKATAPPPLGRGDGDKPIVEDLLG